MTTTTTKPVESALSARLKRQYNERIAPELAHEFKLANIHQVPRIEKVVINAGLGRAQGDKKVMDAAVNTLRKISAQQPVETRAKKSIASFKLREGSPIGLKVTLRGERMYEFLDRLISLVLPRLRDFHGVSSKAFDKSGNYHIGLVDQSAFPELSFEETTTAHGLQVTIVINNSEPSKSKALLVKFGMPFEKSHEKPRNKENQ